MCNYIINRTWFCTASSVASIIDFLRCSITFTTPKGLLTQLNKLVNDVKNGKIECIEEIVGIKNGFHKVNGWNKVTNCQYCDLKLNVVIWDPQTNTSMVVEIQFLLKINYML